MPADVPILVDVEASGFGYGSYPIEIGVAHEDGTTSCYLVRPAAGWSHWAPAAEAVHGIRRELLLQRGLTVESVADALNETLDGQTVFCDAWGFDVAWIARLFEAARRNQHFRVETIFRLLDEAQYEAWNEMVQAISEELSLQRHRASSDARIQQLAYLRLQVPER